MQGLPNIGDVLDETYRVESLLGQGGFGAVYLARQMSMDRQVAIKVLVAHAMNVEEMIERFRREVMAVRNLSHPNTIRIYDFRDSEDGILYYVMEYVKGCTLKEIIKEAPIPIKRVKHILRQIVKSLSEAHSYGIIHRDLKPANIMLADLHGETDFVKVVDFGIAKIMGGQENEDDADPLTSAGVLVGTLRYMAPEQITGQGIGPQSDLYALGLIAIEMLTGKSVFEGTGRWEVLHKQISDDPVDIPQELIQSAIGPFLQKALEKRLDHRFKNADEMLVALDLVPDGTVTAAAAPAPAAKAAVVAPKNDDATMMSPLPELTPPDNTGQIADPAVDPDATQFSPLPSDEELASVQQRASRPMMQTNPSLSMAAVADDEDFVAPKSPVGKIIAVVVVVLLIGGGAFAYFANQPSTPDDGVDPDVIAVIPTPNTAAQIPVEIPVQPVVEPNEVKNDEPVVAAEKWVRISTPAVSARLFKGDSFVGATPVRVKFVEGEQWTVRAVGYVDLPLALNESTPEDFPVEMTKVASRDTKQPSDKPLDKPADKPVDDWVDVTAKPKDKPADKPADSSSDWVDVKKVEKDKPKVPLF